MVHKNVHLHSAGSNTHDRVEKSPASDGKISFLHFAQTEDICLKSSVWKKRRRLVGYGKKSARYLAMVVESNPGLGRDKRKFKELFLFSDQELSDPLKQGFLNQNFQIEIAGFTSAFSFFAHALQPQMLPVPDPRGDRNEQFPAWLSRGSR
jgi:hypothetical protein